MPFKILLPVDGSDVSLRAVRHVARMAERMRPMEVHLVNVQPLVDDWKVTRVLKAEELARLEQEWGDSAIQPARAILDEFDIAHIEHIEKGEPAPIIARLAHELGCDQIVMGSRGQSSLGGLLMGSVATKVLHLADVPVTFVK